MSDEKKLPPFKLGEEYSTEEPIFVGSFSIRTELEVLPADPNNPVKGWTIGEVVSINGNKYLRLLKQYLEKHGKESEDDLTEEEIEALYEKARFK